MVAKKPRFEAKIEKPPLGIAPRWKVEEDRLWEIAAAVERYKEAGVEIPVE